MPATLLAVNVETPDTAPDKVIPPDNDNVVPLNAPPAAIAPVTFNDPKVPTVVIADWLAVVKLPVTLVALMLPPTYKFLTMPTPPLTFNAPVVVLELSVVFVIARLPLVLVLSSVLIKDVLFNPSNKSLSATFALNVSLKFNPGLILLNPAILGTGVNVVSLLKIAVIVPAQ